METRFSPSRKHRIRSIKATVIAEPPFGMNRSRYIVIGIYYQQALHLPQIYHVMPNFVKTSRSRIFLSPFSIPENHRGTNF